MIDSGNHLRPFNILTSPRSMSRDPTERSDKVAVIFVMLCVISVRLTSRTAVEFAVIILKPFNNKFYNNTIIFGMLNITATHFFNNV